MTYKNRVAVVYIAALFLQIMDATIVNVAIPTLAETFDVTSSQMDWTVLAFTTALGVMTASAGWFSDRFGAKRVFLVSLLGFVVTSAMCGAAQNLEQLVLGRALQGAFAGTITPVGSTLLFNAFPISERSIASRKVVTVAVIAPAVGPVAGGAILEVASWRWIFFVNVPVGLIALVLGWRWLREDEDVEVGRFDITGFVLLATGFSLALYGLSRGGEQGWGSAPILVSLVAGVALLGLLVVFERRATDPLLDLSLVRDRIFRTSNIVALPTYAGFLSLIFLLALYLQDEGGRSALQSGLATFPQPLGVLLMTQIAGRFLYKQLGPRRLIMAGALTATAVGLGLAAQQPTADLWIFQLLMFGRGLAMGLVFVPLQAAVFAKMAPAQMSQATALYGTTRQLSPAIGVAIASTVLSAGLANTVVGSTARIGAYQQAMVISAVMFVLALVAATRLRDEDAAATMAR